VTEPAGVEANARLTSSAAVLLLVLLAAEGATIPAVHSLLRPHVFIGFALIPPVALKVASTGYRFVRYYTGAPAYRQKGPPPAFLRLLGPLVIVSTVVLLASGVALLFVHGPWQQRSLTIHKASFVLWFGAMTVHVVGHLFETVRLAPRDWSESRAVRVRCRTPFRARHERGGRRLARCVEPRSSRDLVVGPIVPATGDLKHSACAHRGSSLVV
jgi:hypothetical protein